MDLKRHSLIFQEQIIRNARETRDSFGYLSFRIINFCCQWYGTVEIKFHLLMLLVFEELICGTEFENCRK